MVSQGIIPHGGMLASYVLALMRAGNWKLALETRGRYGKEELLKTKRHADKLDFRVREDAVVDAAVANGLVDNDQSSLALEYVLDVLRARSEVSSARRPAQSASGTSHFCKMFICH